LTYLDTDPSSDLPYSPKITGSAGMNFGFFSVFRLNVDCQCVDGMNVDSQARPRGATNSSTVDSYFLTNAKLSYNFSAMNRYGKRKYFWQVRI
jgi:hypothetical protein